MSKKNGRVNVAVAGLGYMGATHLRAYQKIRNVRVVAVCDAIRQPENGVLRGIAGNIKSDAGNLDLGPKLKAYRDFGALLADPEVDLVDICTPTPLHPKQVIAALKAGKHVLCEKPLARASADVGKILAVAAKSKGFLMPAMCMRFWTGWGELKAIVEGGKYGRVLAAHFRRVSQMPAWSIANAYAGADMGGALYDLHIHDVDFINYIFGKPKSVLAGGVISKNGSIDHVVAQYEYPGGPLVSAEGSWLHQGGFSMDFAINFERATIEYSFAKGGVWILSEAGKKPRVVAWRGCDGYDGEIRYFVNCVARGVQPDVVTARDALATMQICEAEEKSARAGARVMLPR